jgi:hypothetical protein
MSSYQKGIVPMLLYDLADHIVISTYTDFPVNICYIGMLVSFDAIAVLQSTVEKRVKTRFPDPMLLFDHLLIPDKSKCQNSQNSDLIRVFIRSVKNVSSSQDLKNIKNLHIGCKSAFYHKVDTRRNAGQATFINM